MSGVLVLGSMDTAALGPEVCREDALRSYTITSTLIYDTDHSLSDVLFSAWDLLESCFTAMSNERRFRPPLTPDGRLITR